MEIQDRNSLLQLLFGAREGKTATVMPQDNAGFADMLKSQNNEAEKVMATRNDFQEAKENKVSAQVKEKNEIPTKDAKKENVKDKQPARNEVKKDKEVKKENKTENNAEGVAVNTETSVKNTEQPQTENTGVEKDVDNIAETDIVAEVEAQPVAEMPSLLPLSFAEDGKTLELPVEKLEPVVNNDNEIAVVKDVAVAETEAVKSETSAEKVSGGQAVTEEEALLFEQAQILDEKINPSQKIKVSVDVKEEKIASPIVKDVLQNRFEVETLFRQADVSDQFENTEVATMSLEVEDNNMSADNKPVVEAPTVDIDAFAVAENMPLSATNEQIATEVSNVAISGKEVVLETANQAKTKTFSRLNETSSNENLKGMGKEVVEQIKVNITKSAIKGVDTIDIQLKPEDLGKIQIRMHITKDGKLQADIISSRAETMDMLQKEVSGLAKAFSDAGYDTDSRSFNFSFQGENQAKEHQKDDSGLLQFIGDTLEQEAESAAGNDNLVYDPALGLNIRV